MTREKKRKKFEFYLNYAVEKDMNRRGHRQQKKGDEKIFKKAFKGKKQLRGIFN
jgi:hypothetical protein